MRTIAKSLQAAPEQKRRQVFVKKMAQDISFVCFATGFL